MVRVFFFFSFSSFAECFSTSKVVSLMVACGVNCVSAKSRRLLSEIEKFSWAINRPSTICSFASTAKYRLKNVHNVFGQHSLDAPTCTKLMYCFVCTRSNIRMSSISLTLKWFYYFRAFIKSSSATCIHFDLWANQLQTSPLFGTNGKSVQRECVSKKQDSIIHPLLLVYSLWLKSLWSHFRRWRRPPIPSLLRMESHRLI